MVKIALCMVVRNDQDILKYNLIYHYNIGFRDFYIMLHKPTDEQFDNVVKIQNIFIDKGCNFYIQSHHRDEHRHEQDIKVLIDQAKESGFKWMCGIDADEIIRLQKHNTIQELIAEYDSHEAVELRFQWFEHRPLKNVYPPDNAFLIFSQRNIERREQHKAIGKFDNHMFYCAGVHLIHKAPKVIEIPFETAYYSHFPDRNVVQYVEKYMIQYVNWMERYKNFSLAEQIQNDEWFLYKHWDAQIVTDFSDKILDQVQEYYFEI
jgi:hypothetical protein